MKKKSFLLFVALMFIASCSENEQLNPIDDLNFDKDSATKLGIELTEPEYPILHFDSLNYSVIREDYNTMSDKGLLYPVIEILNPSDGEKFNQYLFSPDQCIVMWYKVSNLHNNAHVKAYIDNHKYRDFWIPVEATWIEDQFCGSPWELGVGDHTFKIWATHKIFGVSFTKTKSITFNIYYAPPIPLSVYIDGPTHLNQGESGTFTAYPSGGSGEIINYRWWYRNDEGIFEKVFNNDITPLAPPPGEWIYLSEHEGERSIVIGPSFDFSVKCEVKDSKGNIASGIHSVIVN